MLTINMLGKINISIDGENIVDKLNNKLIALICLLVMNRNRDMSKGKIASILWPDSDGDAGRYNLRYNLWLMNKLIPPDSQGAGFIIAGKDSCRINEGYLFVCDKCLLDRFCVSMNPTVEQLAELKEQFKGDFLEGLYLKNCNEFNELVLFERVVCQNRQVEILKELVSAYERENRLKEGLQVLSEMMAVEPYNEACAHRLMDFYSRLGNRTAAIHYYKQFERSLRGNLGISPNDELKALYAGLIQSPCGRKQEDREGHHGKKRKIVIEGNGIKELDYYWISDVLTKLLAKTEHKHIFAIDKRYIADLGFVHNALLLEYERHTLTETMQTSFVPAVRISHAFVWLLQHLTENYDLKIIVNHPEQIDPASHSILKAAVDSGVKGIVCGNP